MPNDFKNNNFRFYSYLQDAINLKREKFSNLNQLASSRLKEGCTWLRDKNGDLRFYDRVDYPEEALGIRTTYSLEKEIEVEEVEDDKPNTNENENNIDEAKKIEDDVTRKTGVAAAEGKRAAGESQWIEMEDKDGGKYWYNQVTDDYK